MLYNTGNKTKYKSAREGFVLTGIREEFAVTGMSMKCKGALLTNRQVAQISLRHIIFICVHERNDKLKSKAHIEFSAIYN